MRPSCSSTPPAWTSGDFFEFEIRRSGEADVGAAGGVRFGADAFVGGRLFEQLVVDVAFDQEPFTPIDRLAAPDLLDFAGIKPALIPAVPLEQHLAEKLHAYTRSYGHGHPSSRPKDLIDMVLISELADFRRPAARRCRPAALRAPRHPRIARLPPGPAHRLGASLSGPRRGSRGRRRTWPGGEQVARLLDPLLAGGHLGAVWDPITLRWR